MTQHQITTKHPDHALLVRRANDDHILIYSNGRTLAFDRTMAEQLVSALSIVLYHEPPIDEAATDIYIKTTAPTWAPTAEDL